MKLDEFERKLSTVSDDKLLKMLEAARRDGPEVAAKVLESEAVRRGLVFSESRPAHEESGNMPVTSPEAAERVKSAFAGMDEFQKSPPSDEPQVQAALAEGEPPATQSAWLDEEVKAGLPPLVKAVLFIAALGGVIGALFKFFARE